MQDYPRVRAIITMLALCIPMASLSSPKEQVVLGRLDDVQCPDNRGFFSPKSKVDESVFLGDCVLAFTGPDEGGGEGESAVMRFNGSDVQLRIKRKAISRLRAHYEFVNKSMALTVVVDSRQSCLPDVEGCDYTGSMVVVSPAGSSKIHIVYYRGG